MKSFYWVFRAFLRDNDPYPIQAKLGVSEKAVRSWSYPEDSTFHRTNPIDRCVKVLDVLDERTPDLLFETLQTIAKRYGYSICSKDQKEHYSLSQLNKELNDVVQSYLEAQEDLIITGEEKEKIKKEILEALYALNQKLAELEG